MKALSIRKPWAYAILQQGKRVENRDWRGCSYRGPILIHAAKTLTLLDFDEDVEAIRGILTKELGREVPGLLRLPPDDLAVWGTARNTPGWRPAPTLPLGGIVGRARIVDVVRPQEHHRPTDSTACSACCNDACPCASPWYAGGFALVLADVEPLPFRPFRGALGLFDVPDELGKP